jgi:hypothetical protein
MNFFRGVLIDRLLHYYNKRLILSLNVVKKMIKKTIILLMIELIIMSACQNPRALSISYTKADDVDTFNFSEVKEVKSDWHINNVFSSISLIWSLSFFVFFSLAEQELDEDIREDRRIMLNSVSPNGTRIYNIFRLLSLLTSDRVTKYSLLFGKFFMCVSMCICSYKLANPTEF